MQLEHVGPLLVVEPESSSEIGDLGGGQVRSGRRCRRRGRGAYGGANHCGAVQEKKRNTGGRNLRKKAGISPPALHCTAPGSSPPPPGTGSRRRRGDDEGSDWRSGNAGGRQSEKSHLSPRAPTFSSLLLLLLLLLVS
jgi:hypothetical protein